MSNIPRIPIPDIARNHHRNVIALMNVSLHFLRPKKFLQIDNVAMFHGFNYESGLVKRRYVNFWEPGFCVNVDISREPLLFRECN